jgi:hypothetical protein
VSAGPRSPVNRWFPIAIVAATLVAALSGWLFYRNEVRARSVDALSDSTREELSALEVPAIRTAAVERDWVAAGFKSDYLIAPVGPMPCEAVIGLVPPHEQSTIREAWAASRQEDSDVRIEQLAAINDAAPNNLLVVQMLGTALADAGLYPDAERVIAQGLSGTGEDEEITQAARTSTTLDLDDLKVSTVIHLHHALGVARLSQSSAQPPWIALKNVIGSVKPLSKRRLLGPMRDQPVWSRLLIAAPGCPQGTAGSLSSYDLFNNLIVGYMRGKFTGGTSEREREFARPKKNFPGALHKLLLAQVARERANGWQNEAQLWALSNVEQVIDWRMPDDARLAFNAVQVIDWWTSAEHCPRDVCNDDLLGEIGVVRNRLIEQAFKRQNVTADQRAGFAKGMVRMLASSTVKRADVASAAEKIAEWLPASERKTLDDLIAADVARAELPKYLFAKVDDDPAKSAEPKAPPQAKLGTRAERWQAAALTDVASVAAMWAAGRSASEQRSVVIALRQLLGASEAPPELLALEKKHTWADRVRMRLTASKPLWAVLGAVLALVVWLVLAWLLVHLREWQLLHTSLYNVEIEHLSKIDRNPERAP